MALNYKIYQSNREGENKGKFYARASHRDTVTIKELAQTMQSNSTVKYSDILAVLAELSEVMKAELQRSNKVKIDGLGTFKVGISSSPADTAKDFNVAKNIKGTHVLFLPESIKEGNGARVKSLLAGIKVKEADAYDAPKDKEGGE